MTLMNIRQRKLAGTVIFVAGSAFYFFVAITIAIARLRGTSNLSDSLQCGFEHEGLQQQA